MTLPEQFRKKNAEDILIYHYVEELVSSYRGFMAKRFVDEDISLVELPYFLRLRFNNNNTQKELVEVFKVSEGYAAKLLRRFEDRGLISREENPNNHSQKIVKLTEKGIKKSDIILDLTEDWENKVTKNLDNKYSLKKYLFTTVKETENIVQRSEERRVGKDYRSRWSPYH